MANAARVHAVERGKELQDRTMIAFGGAAPIHAARLAEKLGINRVLVPSGAGVGSAVGFLMAPVAYEVVRSRYVQLDADKFDPGFVNRLFAEMHENPSSVARATRSIGNAQPPKAPEPIGQQSAMRRALPSRRKSRKNASACARTKCENRSGWAC